MVRRYQNGSILTLMIVLLFTVLISMTGSEAVLDTQPPTVPEQLSPTELTDTSFTLIWSQSIDDVGVDHYKVYLNDQYIQDSIQSSYSFSSLSPDTVYECSVSAVDATGNESALSESIFVKTLLPKIQTITTVSSCDAIVLTWDAQPDAISYEIMADSTSPDVITATTYSHLGLSPGTIHTYRIRTNTVNNISVWSDEIKVATLLDTPLNLFGKCLDTFIDYTWDPVEGAVTYELDLDGTIISGIQETKYRYGSLSPNSTHSAKIRAVMANTETVWSDTLIKTTLPQVLVGGTINQNTTYTASNVYVVNSNLTVSQGAILTIEPGTVVKYKAGTSLMIQGQVNIAATNGQEVIFTALKDSLYGGTGIASTSDYWNGIHVKTTGDFHAEYFKLFYSKGFSFDGSNRTLVAEGRTILKHIYMENISGTGVYVASGNVFFDISDSLLRNIQGSGVSLVPTGNGSYTIMNNQMEVCNYGIYFNLTSNGNFTISNNKIQGCIYGIYLNQFGTGNLNISENQITNCSTYPFYINLTLLNSDAFKGISNNQIIATNQYNDIVLGGTLKIDLSLEKGKYIVAENLVIPLDISLSITSGTVLRFDTGKYVAIDGKLNLNGNAESPAVLTSIKDSLYGGAVIVFTSDYWNGIHVKSTGEFNAEYVKFFYSKGFSFDGSNRTIVAEGRTVFNHILMENISGTGIYVASGNTFFDISESIFKNIQGAAINLATVGNGSYTIINNQMEGCNYGIYLNQFDTGTLNISENQIVNCSTYPFYINLTLLNSDVIKNISNNQITSTNQYNDIVLGGTLKMDLSLDQGKYIIEGMVIPQDISLSLSSGTVLRVGTSKKITVGGKLNLDGDVASPVVLTSVWDPAYGGSGSTYINDAWSCIVNSTGELNGNHAILQYGGSGSFKGENSFIVIEGTLNLRNSRCVPMKQTWVYPVNISANTSKVINVSNCIIEWGKGIRIIAANKSLIEDSKFIGGLYGVYNESFDDVSITNCTFSNVYDAIVNKTNSVGNLVIENSIIQNCTRSGIKIEQFGTGALSIKNNNITNSGFANICVA